jgi:hypothetical protein
MGNYVLQVAAEQLVPTCFESEGSCLDWLHIQRLKSGSDLMPLPTPQESTASHFYNYSGPSNLGWLKDILHKHELYLPNLTQLNDDNDGLPRLAVTSACY